MVTPRHPHAWIDVDHVQHPAIVLEWIPHQDVSGYPRWLAKCLYWLDGAPKVTTVPVPNVRKA